MRWLRDVIAVPLVSPAAGLGDGGIRHQLQRSGKLAGGSYPSTVALTRAKSVRLAGPDSPPHKRLIGVPHRLRHRRVFRRAPILPSVIQIPVDSCVPLVILSVAKDLGCE
jgi:hypothetical protein